jgi:protein TonB
MPNFHSLWPRFLLSVMLHGIVLGGAACWYACNPGSAFPIFHGGEFSLELSYASAGAPPEAPADPVFSPPAPAADPQPTYIAREPQETLPTVKPPEATEAPAPADAPEGLQLITDLPVASARLPNPYASAPLAPNHADGRGQAGVGLISAPTAGAAAGGAAKAGLPNMPRLASYVHPVYPPGARQRGEEGVVTVRAVVTAQGQAQTAEVDRSSGFPALDQAALNAVRQAHFIPARQGRQAVESRTLLTFRFTLVD